MMKRILVVCAIAIAALPALATTYYVDCDDGNDSNAGTSESAAFKTLAQMETVQLHGGDTVKLKRGCVWEENYSINSANDATSSNRITIEPYGVGEPPTLKGTKTLSLSGFTYYSSKVFRISFTPAAAITPHAVRFDGLYFGTEETSTADLDAWGDWMYDGTTSYLYIYAPDWNPLDRTYTKIEIMNEEDGIVLGSDSYVTIRGLRVQEFPRTAIYVWSSPGLVIEYCELRDALTRLPTTATPLLSSYLIRAYGSSGDVTVRNCTLFGGGRAFYANAGTTFTITNTLAFANSTGMEGPSGATFNYDHSAIAWNQNSYMGFLNQDIVGSATYNSGVGNIDSTTPDPGFASYPYDMPYFTFSFDDFCMSSAKDTWAVGICDELKLYGYFADFGCETGYPDYGGRNTNLQNLYNDGCRLASHSWSHSYGDDAFSIQYTGASACTMDITSSGATMTLTTSGCDGNTLSYDLLSAAYDTIGEVCDALNADPNYTCAAQTAGDPALSSGLADVTGADVKTAAYTAQFDRDRHYRNESEQSYKWLKAQNWDSDTSTDDFIDLFIYPGGVWYADSTAKATHAWFQRSRGVAGIWEGWGGNLVSLPGGYPLYGIPCPSARDGDNVGASMDTKRKNVFSYIVSARVLGVGLGCTWGHQNTWTATDVREMFQVVDEYPGVQVVHYDTWYDWFITANRDFFVLQGNYGPTIYSNREIGWHPVPGRGSVLIDAGTNWGTTEDIMGNPIHGNPDIGAYEYQPPGIYGRQ